MQITGIPLSVLNRALDLYGLDREATAPAAMRAIDSAAGRLDVSGPLTPLAQALAEYMSLSGPWSEDDGEYAGENGYSLSLA